MKFNISFVKGCLLLLCITFLQLFPKGRTLDPNSEAAAYLFESVVFVWQKGGFVADEKLLRTYMGQAMADEDLCEIAEKMYEEEVDLKLKVAGSISMIKLMKNYIIKFGLLTFSATKLIKLFNAKWIKSYTVNRIENVSSAIWGIGFSYLFAKENSYEMDALKGQEIQNKKGALYQKIYEGINAFLQKASKNEKNNQPSSNTNPNNSSSSANEDDFNDEDFS
jgi:hypothetical protein